MNDAVSISSDHLCAACACCCDDLTLTVANGRASFNDNSCALARSRLAAATDDARPAALIDGQPASLEAAVARAADLLNQSRLPTVYGCMESTVETQALAVKIARLLGGVMDSPALPDAPLFPNVGRITCSLGEAKNRADLVVLWDCDVADTHPRLLSHFLLDPRGRFRPGGRGDRTLIHVGPNRNAHELGADMSVTRTLSDFAHLTALRAHLRSPRHAGLTPQWRRFADRLTSARFGVLVIDGSSAPSEIDAAGALAMELQRRTRFYVVVLPRAANSVGLQQVVAWLTGRCAPVCFSRPEPAFGSEFRLRRLVERGETDAVLNINGDLPVQQTSPIPQIHVSARIADLSQLVAVAIRTADFPVSDSGTVFRLDGVAQPLRSAIPSSAPSQFQVLSQIAQRLHPPAN